MQSIITQLEQKILEVVSTYDTEGVDVSVKIERPKDDAHGDFSTNIALQLAKHLKKNPLELANELASKLQTLQLEHVDKVEAVTPGFVNFFVSGGLYKPTLQEISDKGGKFGHSEVLKDKTILIEHTSPNPNKEFHLGHLKNNVTGLSISYLFEAQGAEVFRDCIDNNRGIAIARLMYGYLAHAKKDEALPTDLKYWYKHRDQWLTPEEVGKTPGKFVDELYTKGSADFEKNPEVEQLVRQLVVDWESEDPQNLELWSKTQEWVWEGYEQSLSRVNGWKFDKIWHEHELYKKGKEHVQRGLAEGKFRKLEDGAIITDLKKEFSLPDTVLIKKDGTTLYITQDLELTSLKRKTFNPDDMFWVIGPEQSLAMKQMFAVCSQLGFGKYEDFHHIPYGFILVKNKEGKPEKMSSRKGTQYHVNDLIDRARDEILTYITSENLSEKEKNEIAEKVAIGAVKYSLLKVSRTQDMVFDFATTISFEGDSAPYIMYAYARAQSILAQAKAGVEPGVAEDSLTAEPEVNLLKHLSKFPALVDDAASSYMPSIICAYVYDLAQKFSQFYNLCPVLNADSDKDKNARLALVKATAQVLKNGLALLGIETVEKM